MRKLYWGCVAAVLTALGLWQTADYVRDHADSILVPCVTGFMHAGLGFNSVFGTGSASDTNAEEAVEIPSDPEPVADAEFPCPLGHDRTGKSGLFVVGGGFHMYSEEQASCEDNRRGRLPGKIVIEDSEEPPLAMPERLASEPNLDRFVARIEAQWKNDDTVAATEVTTAFWKTTGEYVRQMPFCADDDNTPVMPPAADPELTPRKKEPPRIWFPFMPKGTEVGGDKELSPNGNDCREDPSIPLQLPGCLAPAMRESKKVPVTSGEETSEPAEPQNKETRPIEGPKTNRRFDESKLQPFAAPVKLDTMEFRPSDWGKRDVAVPPF
jgi:hypothetical protein